MILSFYYMYATLVQWWRLKKLRRKLSDTLTKENALLLYVNSSGNTTDRLLSAAAGAAAENPRRCLENLLFTQNDRIACTIVPRQKVHLSQWISFPSDRRTFPIHCGEDETSITNKLSKRHQLGYYEGGSIYLLLRADLELQQRTGRSDFDNFKMEKLGRLLAWKAGKYLEVVLETDLHRLAVVMNTFRNYPLAVNHELPLVKVETIDIDGRPGNFTAQQQCQSARRKPLVARTPEQFRHFVDELRHLYKRINENMSPKITIESGGAAASASSSGAIKNVAPVKHHHHHHHHHHHNQNAADEQQQRRIPVSEVKPIKKSPPPAQPPPKNTLEVHAAGSPSGRRKHSPPTGDSTSFSKRAKTKASTNQQHQSERIVVKRTKANKSEEKVGGASANKAELIAGDGVRHMTVNEAGFVAGNGAGLPPEGAGLIADEAGLISDNHREPNDNREAGPVADREAGLKVEKGAGLVDKEPGVNETEAGHIDEEAASKKTYSEVAAKNLKRQDATALKETSATKPPSILIYADSVLARENVKSVLKAVLDRDKYTLHDLTPASIGSSHPTTAFGNARLIIVCGSVTPEMTPRLLDYLVVGGGQLLCLCSDLLYSVLHTYSTAEVREHELVRFTYGEWRRVKMMHHIFCYQASPAKKQFSRDSSDQQLLPSPGGSSPVAPRTPSTVDIQHGGRTYTIQVQVLGAEETWQTPSLLLATVKSSKTARAVFSQVHLEIDPTQYQDDESKYAALKDSNQARLEILRHILSTQLNIDCRSSSANFDADENVYSPAYFLGRHDLKLELLNNNSNVKENKLKLQDLEAVFCFKGVEPGVASPTRLPILVVSCPSNFSTVDYFGTLNTQHVGRLMIYADVMSSTHKLVNAKLTHGLCVVAKRQTQGKGRAGNEWLSPEGCAMFSLQLHIDLKSNLGQSLPLVQLLLMVAIVRAVKGSVKNEEGGGALELALKWPNDLYAYGSVKVGGLIVTSLVECDTAVVNIGCGVNLDNKQPTICVNDMLEKLTGPKGRLQSEKYFALVFNETETLLDSVQTKGVDWFIEEYYKHWLHTDAKITITNGEGGRQEVTIRGVDRFGFLVVEDAQGRSSSVQPDGNSFDMLSGLIAPKI